MFITIDPTGTLIVVDKPANAETVRAVVGDFDLLHIDRKLTMYGFVADDGFTLGLPRNPTGACLLAALGAAALIIAGTVVITGWDRYASGPETRDLTPERIAMITEIHGHVVAALSNMDAQGESTSWAQQMRVLAEHVRTAQDPMLTFVPLTRIAKG